MKGKSLVKKLTYKLRNLFQITSYREDWRKIQWYTYITIYRCGKKQAEGDEGGTKLKRRPEGIEHTGYPYSYRLLEMRKKMYPISSGLARHDERRLEP